MCLRRKINSLSLFTLSIVKIFERLVSLCVGSGVGTFKYIIGNILGANLSTQNFKYNTVQAI